MGAHAGSSSRTRASAAALALAGALALSAGGSRPAPTAGPPAPSALTPSAPSRAASAPAPSRSPVAKPRPTPSLVIPSLPTFTARGAAQGGDVSWPQCPKGMGIPQKRSKGAPMPLGSAEFVVIGLTNGPGFVANPCLADQVAWAEQRHLLTSAYAVISAPYGDVLARYGGTGPYDAGTAAGRLGNVGYQQALFNVGQLRATGLETPMVWLDVEPVPDFDWTADTVANAAVVRGAVRGYEEQGYSVGVYSIGTLWRRVVGDLRLGLPEWRPAGSAGRAEAVRRCAGDWMFQGGAAVLAQWVENGRDRDVTCPEQAPYLSLWFHQY